MPQPHGACARARTPARPARPRCATCRLLGALAFRCRVPAASARTARVPHGLPASLAPIPVSQVSDAMRHLPHCLTYMARLRDPDVFRFCAIPQARRRRRPRAPALVRAGCARAAAATSSKQAPRNSAQPHPCPPPPAPPPQVMALGTFALCYNNGGVFEGVVKMRRGETARVFAEVHTYGDALRWFRHFLGALAAKAGSEVAAGDPTVEVRLCRAGGGPRRLGLRGPRGPPLLVAGERGAGSKRSAVTLVCSPTPILRRRRRTCASPSRRARRWLRTRSPRRAAVAAPHACLC